jgi:hypothetical protein
MAEARCNQLLADNKRLQEKYDEKVAEVQDLKLDLKLLQARSGGPGLSSGPFPWSSPMAKRGRYRGPSTTGPACPPATGNCGKHQILNHQAGRKVAVGRSKQQ